MKRLNERVATARIFSFFAHSFSINDQNNRMEAKEIASTTNQ